MEIDVTELFAKIGQLTLLCERKDQQIKAMQDALARKEALEKLASRNSNGEELQPSETTESDESE